MEVVLISPVCPFDPRDGHRLAVLSDVHALLDNGIDIGLVAFTYQGEADTLPELCPTVRIEAGKGGFAARFARSIWKGLPPSAERLYNAEAQSKVREQLQLWSPRIVIFDDTSVAGYVPDIRSLLPQAKVILRTHNVMHDVRSEHLRRARGLGRAAVSFDRDRYIRFERTAVQSCDRHWAITTTDAARIKALYDRPGSTLTVSVPLERYNVLLSEPGKLNGFSHIGSLDFRRRADLTAFLDNNWPRILKADPTASLTLAGELKGNPIAGKNVIYTGRVKSDAAIYGQARFALNFQSSPGGVKLKTLTSLAAGRSLLSTREGVEGIDIQSGREFFEIDQFLARNDLRALLADAQATQPVADAGRQYVAARHSRKAVATQMLKLLEEV